MAWFLNEFAYILYVYNYSSSISFVWSALQQFNSIQCSCNGTFMDCWHVYAYVGTSCKTRFICRSVTTHLSLIISHFLVYTDVMLLPPGSNSSILPALIKIETISGPVDLLTPIVSGLRLHSQRLVQFASDFLCDSTTPD